MVFQTRQSAESCRRNMADLTLREIQKDDWPALQACLGDEETVRFTEFEPLTEARARGLVSWALEARQKEPRQAFVFGISPMPGAGLIGIATLIIRDAELREADIGFIVRREHWGRGYATAAVREMLALGFRTLHLHRIYGECDPANAGSGRVMEKAGMVREGLRRECLWQKGRWVDRLLYAVLDREWAQANEKSGR